MAVTMQDIAAAAGLSRPTVSLILNGRDADLRIAAETRQRVLDLARELGYRRNELARAVKRGRSNMVVFLGGARTSYEMNIIAGINAGLQARGYILKLLLLESGTDFGLLLRQCQEQMAAGIICRSLSQELLDLLCAMAVPAGIPVMQVDNSLPLDWCGRVASDDVAGGRLAATHLLDSGRRRIGLLTLPGNAGFIALRRQGYRDALAAAGLPFEPELECILPPASEWTPALESRLTSYLREQRPDAVFCVSDPLALQLLLGARAAGLTVPRDLAVVGYANLDYAAFASPPLTTVAQPFAAMGEAAAHRLIDVIAEGASPAAVNLQLPVRLVVRQSAPGRTQA